MSDVEKGQEPSPKKRRWLKCFLVLAVLLGVIVWAVNGLVARKVSEYFILKGLKGQGLTGEVTVTGSLAEGLTLKEANFVGELGIQKMKFKEVGVVSSPEQLIREKVLEVRARDLELVIDVAKFPKKRKEREKQKFDLDELRKKLAKIRESYLPIYVDIGHIDLTLLRNAAPLAEVELSALQHSTDSFETHLKGFQVRGFQSRDTPVQDVTLTWGEERLSLDHLEVLPEISVADFSCSLVEQSEIEVKANIQLFDANFALQVPTFHQGKISLTSGQLEFSEMLELFGREEDLDGVLKHCAVTIDGLTGDAQIEVQGLKYEDYELQKTELKFRLNEEQADFTLRLQSKGDEVLTNIKGQMPIDGVKSFEDLKARPLALDISVPEVKRFEAFIKGELPQGQLAVQAVYPLGSQDVKADFDFQEGRFNDSSLPQVKGTVDLLSEQLKAELELNDGRDHLDVDFDFHLVSQIYSFTAKGAAPIQEQLASATSLLRLNQPLELNLTGSGDLTKGAHRVNGDIETAVLFPTDDVNADISTKIVVDWPQSFGVSDFTAVSRVGQIKGGLHWEDEKLAIQALKIFDQGDRLLEIDGDIPLPLQLKSIDDLLANQEPIDLNIVADEFSISRFQHLLPMAREELGGKLNGAMQIGGTFANPRLDGKIEGRDWVWSQLTAIQPISFALASSTDHGVLLLDGFIKEGGVRLATLKGELPVTITEWLKDEAPIDQTPLSFSLTMKELDLQRFTKAIPQLDRVEGILDVNLNVGGTVARPEFKGTTQLNAQRVRFGRNDKIPDLKDSELKLSFDSRVITIEPSTLIASGGTYALSGKINLEGEQPVFNVKLVADKALVWRDDSLSIRSDGNLRLVGTLEQASLTGDLGIAESLYYKDIEFIPFGVPSGTVPTPQLPELSVAGNTKAIPLPEPYANWTLDVNLSTKDPILIRGNLAEGELVARGKIRGNLGKPLITLDADLKKTLAELPLSKLDIKTGKITLRPGEGFIPSLNIRGVSRVGQHQVYLYAYGKATSPKLVFTSNPPLPEAEVLTLLATGTTTSGLEDQQVASVKAFQILLSELKRKYSKPGESKIVGKFFETLDTVDLRVGDSDPFSGRRFNSATLQLSSKFYASAAFDNEGNSRGILIYALRF